ncbi:MAG TPA: MFS transporter, partial [Acidimicrobiales bacterium]
MTDDESAAEPLSRNIKVLSAVSFFQDTASEMLYPILPIFVTSVLGAPPAVLGLIEGIAEATASLSKVFSGRLADLRRRRPLVATGYSISAIAKPLIGLATGWPLVLVGRFADRVGKGVRGPPRDALIADDTTPANRGRAFGFHRAADTAGAVVGPLLGLALYEAMGQRLRPLFFIAFVPAALSVGLIFLVREGPHPRAHGQAAEPFSLAGLTPRYWRVLALLGAFSLVNFSDTLLLLRATDLGMGVVGVSLVYVLYNLSYASLSYPAGRVSDRLPRRLVFAVGLVAFAIAYVGLGLVSTKPWLWVLFPIYGGYTALTDGVSRAWVADLVPRSEVGTALGVYGGVAGIGAFVASVGAGLAWGGNGRLPLLVAGAVAALVAVLLVAGGRRLDPVT